MNKIIAIAGMPGSGKSTTADILVQMNFQYLRFGQIVIDEVKKRGLPVNEQNEKKVREELRTTHGMAAMAKLNISKIKKMLKFGNVVADGLYSFSEYKILKENFKNTLIVLAIYAPPSVRYSRLTKRKNNSEDKNNRFRPLTIKEAKARDFNEIENLEKGGPIAMADITILNISSLKYLKNEIKKIIKEII